ncbi:hypothetical protein DMUE_0225 [Dictyocoela muelleri]|nr:hypothetical protein DMUE_0225 [Dictyocoela muelleri]
MESLYDDHEEKNEISANILNELDLNVEGKRKPRKDITEALIESFISLIDSDRELKDIGTILDFSKPTKTRIYAKYIKEEYKDLKSFMSAGEKRSSKKKDFTLEKSIISSELLNNPCARLRDLVDKLDANRRRITYSRSTIFRIFKSMNNTRKNLTLVPINRNSNQNKILRQQYGRWVSYYTNEQLIFIDDT